APPLVLHAGGLEQVGGRRVLAVLILHADEDPELVARAEVHFELPNAVDDVIVDPFGVVAVAIATRLPAAFEDMPRIPRIGGELRRRSTGVEHAGVEQDSRREQT